MRQRFVSKTLMALLAVSLFVALGCDRERTEEAVGFSDVPINTGPLKLKLDELNDPSECDPEERPEDIGCTTLCKPCVTSLCLDGKWVAEHVEIPKDLCEPPEPDDPGPFGCPSGDFGFCPAECSFCYPS